MIGPRQIVYRSQDYELHQEIDITNPITRRNSLRRTGYSCTKPQSPMAEAAVLAPLGAFGSAAERGPKGVSGLQSKSPNSIASADPSPSADPPQK